MTARNAFLSLSLAFALGGGACPASAFDASAHADEEVIEVVTANEDGSLRTTKIWIVVVDGSGYIRTGSTRWGANAVRDPDVRIRAADGEHDLRVEFVTDEAERGRVVEAFRAKYGWSDRLLSPFRGRSPKIMRLVERNAGG